MRAEDRMASLQLRRVLNRLEEEKEEKQETLRRRVEEERGKLTTTMRFSRATVEAALAQEVELKQVRKVKKARLKAVASKSKPTPALPELAEVTPENDSIRLLNENRRLAEEVVQLRARIREMAAVKTASKVVRPGVAFDAPGSPPYAQMEELHSNVDRGDEHGGSLARLTLPKSREAEIRATDASTLSGQAGHINPTAAPSPSSEVGVRSGFRGEDGANVGEGARRVSSVKAEDEARAPSSTVLPSTKARTASADGDGCRAWDSGIVGIDKEEFRQLVEAEAATVLEELRANPPAAVKALLQVRQGLDACAAAAVAINKTASILLSSGLLPAAMGDGIGDRAAAVFSSKGAKISLHEVGTRSAELGEK